jgi:hypothetical protein
MTNTTQKLDELIKKLVSNCKALLSNQIGFPLGMRKMDKIIGWINDVEPLNNIDTTIFSEYNSRIANLGVGIERLLYSPEFLKKEEKILDNLGFEYKERIIDKCFEIIQKFDN